MGRVITIDPDKVAWIDQRNRAAAEATSAAIAPPPPTRMARYIDVANDCTLDDGCELTATPDRYALVEVSQTTNLAWLTTHPNPDAAATYHASSNDNGDWQTQALFDLDTGDRLELPRDAA